METLIDREEVLYQLERLALEAQMVDECEENTIRRCISAVKLVPTLTPPNEWVSVEERLPPPKQNVLVYSPEGGIAEADYGDGVWMQYRWSAVMRGVTHWMPLPAPPGKDNNVPTNKPLTIEQLREMDGEPVWVEQENTWGLVEIHEGKAYIIGLDFEHLHSPHWNVYRRPPEGEEDT